MKKVYNIDLSTRGIKELQKGLQEYKQWLKEKSDELCKRLADMGAVKASLGFARAIYSGQEDHTISVVQKDGGYAVRADGTTVLFVEFGTGLIANEGGGHPEPHGMGAGTYPPTNPDNQHLDDPNGWWYAHNQHTYGNPPNMPMYNTVKELEMELERVVKEVFAL